MKSKRGCWIFMILLLMVSAITAALALLGFWYLRQRQEQARIEFSPPEVMVTEPLAGTSISSGSYFPLSADILTAPNAPLQRVEIWLDGELQEKQEASPEAGALSPYLYTHLLMPSEGAHVLTVRAVNRLGIIGQSDPVLVTGIPKSKDGSLLVPLPAGGNLASLAADYGTDEATLKSMNPGLGGQAPAPGAIIAVPKPAENEKPVAQPPAPPGSVMVIPPSILPLQPAGPAWSGLSIPLLLARPPEPPSNLQTQAKDCQVRLSWNDNSNVESGYKIWMHDWTSQQAQVIAILKPSPGGQTWFEFTSPLGGNLIFWVEAFNALGGQPSNIKHVLLDLKCSPISPTQLQITLLDMNVSGNYDSAYCFVSFGGSPSARLPEMRDNFILVQGGKGQITSWSHTFSIPVPADKVLAVDGECWGWSGNMLTKMGMFSAKFPVQTWNGSRLVLDGGVFQVGAAISPLGETLQSGGQNYAFFPNPNLPPPYNVAQGGTKCPGFNCSGFSVTWEWQPSPKFKDPITGFEIFKNGSAYKTVNDPNARSAEVMPSVGCGAPIRWQVAAIAGTTRSMVSLPFDYERPPCEGYAVVKFETLEIPWTGDGLSDGPCDELQIYYELALRSQGYQEQRKYFGWAGASYVPNEFHAIAWVAWPFNTVAQGGNIMQLLSIYCTKNAPPYTFEFLGNAFKVPNPDTLIVAIPITNITLSIGTFFYDQDTYSADDQFGFRWLQHKFADLQAAQNELGCGKTFRDPPQDYRQEDTADTAISYTLAVYPNACSKLPQGIPLPPPPKK